MLIKIQKNMKKLIFAFFVSAVLMSGCNKTETTTSGGPGRLSVKITDDPFDINYVESATVTITKIEVRKTGASEGDPFIVLSETPVVVDLFQLRNGITQELANLVVPQGNYDLIRLYVDEASLKLKEHAESFSMKVPGGSQTGIKVFISPDIHVEGGISAELLLDFSLSKSFVMRGNMAHAAGVNGFIFKPCIKATNNSTAGRIEGFVTDSSPEKIKLANAKVTLRNDTATAETFTDESGHYVFIGVPAGTYSMTAVIESYDTAGADGVVVFAGNKVIQDFVLSRPLYVSSVIENASPEVLEITYNMTLADSVPDVSAFTVVVNSVARNVSSAAISDAKVLLTLASPVIKNDVITVAYTKPSKNLLQTSGGGIAESFTAQNVTNKVGL
jgi:uncharacterized repeat protein (TIGR02059 family)